MATEKKAHGLTARYAALWVVENSQGAADLARLLKVNRSNAFRRLQVLSREGLIEPGVLSGLRFWRLTASGAAVLQHVRMGFMNRTPSEVLGEPAAWLKTFRWHHLLFKFPRLDERLKEDDGAPLLAAGFSAGRQGFVSGFVRRLDGWRVVVTTQSVLLYCPKGGIVGGSPYDAVLKGLEQSCSIVARVQALLPWLDVAARYELCRQELALMGVAKEWVPEGFRYASDRLVIDFSTGTAEVEAVDRAYAVDDMIRLARFWDQVARGEGSGVEGR